MPSPVKKQDVFGLKRVDFCAGGRKLSEAARGRADGMLRERVLYDSSDKRRKDEFPCGPSSLASDFSKHWSGFQCAAPFDFGSFRTSADLRPFRSGYRLDPVHRESFASAFFGCRFPNCYESSGAGSLSKCFFSALSFWGLAPPLKRTLRLFQKKSSVKTLIFRCKKRGYLCKSSPDD